jgi:hypothetical protein
MSGRNENVFCAICKKGGLIAEDRELTFRQRTDKGYVFCRVTISMDICTQCGFKSWGDLAEAIIEDAVRQEYAKLP